MQGISNDRFAPDQSMTREQMSVLLSRALKLTTPASGGAKTFTDVPAGSWSAEAIAAMSSRGLVDGFEDGTFRPSASLTRAADGGAAKPRPAAAHEVSRQFTEEPAPARGRVLWCAFCAAAHVRGDD